LSTDSASVIWDSDGDESEGFHTSYGFYELLLFILLVLSFFLLLSHMNKSGVSLLLAMSRCRVNFNQWWPFESQLSLCIAYLVVYFQDKNLSIADLALYLRLSRSGGRR
jgi:hypothetical protein